MGNKIQKESSKISYPKQGITTGENSVNSPPILSNPKKEFEEIEISKEYETQVKIPKPILMDIFQRCGLENFLKISLISKQFYFLLKSDNFWMKMLKTTDLNEIEIDSRRKTQSLVEIYRDYLLGWDVEASYEKISFNKRDALNNYGKFAGCAVSKKQFVTGEEDVLFVFEYESEKGCSSCGIKCIST